MNESLWYEVIIKPSWAPPAWLFGPVWSVLYILIAVSFGYVAYMWYTGKIPFVVFLPFLINLAANFAFTPIQFGLKNNTLAAIDAYIILGTLVWALMVVYPYARWVAYTNIPYALWVAFASVLQTVIAYLNWR